MARCWRAKARDAPRSASRAARLLAPRVDTSTAIAPVEPPAGQRRQQLGAGLVARDRGPGARRAPRRCRRRGGRARGWRPSGRPSRASRCATRHSATDPGCTRRSRCRSGSSPARTARTPARPSAPGTCSPPRPVRPGAGRASWPSTGAEGAGVVALPGEGRVHHHRGGAQRLGQHDRPAQPLRRVVAPHPLGHQQARGVHRQHRYAVVLGQATQRSGVLAHRVGPDHDLDAVVPERRGQLESRRRRLGEDRGAGQEYRGGHDCQRSAQPRNCHRQDAPKRP